MNTIDMMIHVHPTLDAHARADLERKLMGRAGIDCAEFRSDTHPHSLVVSYDADTIKRMDVLNIVRETDPDATTLGC